MDDWKLKVRNVSRNVDYFPSMGYAVIMRTKGRIVGWNYTDEQTQPRPSTN